MNVVDEESMKKVKHLRQEMAKKDERSLRFILEHERGRWFFMRLLERCGCIHRSALNDPQEMAMLSAQQQIGDGLDKNIRQMYDNSPSQAMADDIIGSRRLAEDEYFRFKRRFKHLEDERE